MDTNKKELRSFLDLVGSRLLQLQEANNTNVTTYNDLKQEHLKLKLAHEKLKQSVEETYNDSKLIFEDVTGPGGVTYHFDDAREKIHAAIPAGNQFDNVLTTTNLIRTIPTTGVIAQVFKQATSGILAIKYIASGTNVAYNFVNSDTISFTASATNPINVSSKVVKSLFLLVANISPALDTEGKIYVRQDATKFLYIAGGSSGNYVLTSAKVVAISENNEVDHLPVLFSDSGFLSTRVYHGGTGISIVQASNSHNFNVNFDISEITDTIIQKSNVHDGATGIGTAHDIYYDTDKKLKVKTSSTTPTFNPIGTFNYGYSVSSNNYRDIDWHNNSYTTIQFGNENFLSSWRNCYLKDSTIPHRAGTGINDLLENFANFKAFQDTFNHKLGLRICGTTIHNAVRIKIFDCNLTNYGYTTVTVGNEIDSGIYFSGGVQMGTDSDPGDGVTSTTTKFQLMFFWSDDGDKQLTININNGSIASLLTNLTFNFYFYAIRLF